MKKIHNFFKKKYLVSKQSQLIGKNKIGEGTQILGNSLLQNCKIGKKCKIYSSFLCDTIVGDNVSIGPFSHLRPNSVIGSDCRIGNFVEIKNSIIKNKTKIAHLTYVGDSQIGENCNVGCGVVFVNYDGKNKFSSLVGDNVFIGSNCNIIAPVELQDNCFIAAGTTVTQNIQKNDFCIGRVRQEIKTSFNNKYVSDEISNYKFKFFGTDGIRGVYPTDINNSIAIKLAKALVLLKPNCKVVVGKDTRASGTVLEKVFCNAIKTLGASIKSLGVVSTPIVSFFAKSNEYDFGVMITASHNPEKYNGFKIFDKNGLKLTEQEEILLDEYISSENDELFYKNYDIETVSYNGYIEFIKENILMDLTNYKIAIDCANGGTKLYAKNVLEGFGAQVFEVNNDGLKINENCGCIFPENIINHVKANHCDIGFAFDGDGDRIFVCDDLGEPINGDNILFVMAKYFSEINKLPFNKIVATVQSNLGLKIQLQKHGIEVISVQVGDKYVSRKMNEKKICLGGEQSGHIIYNKFSQTGDGLITCLILMKIISESKEKIRKLSKLNLFPQIQGEIETNNARIVLENSNLKNFIANLENNLKNNGRILIRESGTEPKIRILVEASDKKSCEDIYSQLYNYIQNLLSTSK